MKKIPTVYVSINAMTTALLMKILRQLISNIKLQTEAKHQIQKYTLNVNFHLRKNNLR